MKSLLNLNVGKMELDWGKYGEINSFTLLFVPTDVHKIKYYMDCYETVKIVEKNGFCSKMWKIKDRLDLLGYDLNSIEKKYTEHKNEAEHYIDYVPSFEKFYNAIKSLNINEINTIDLEFNNGDSFDLGEYCYKCFLQQNEFYKAFFGEKRVNDCEMVELLKGLSVFLENLDPYITLRILAENDENLDYDVEWHYDDSEENRLYSYEKVTEGIDDSDKITIVTEGSTDSNILKKAIDLLYPHTSDIFKFIDMKDNYPFGGVGNLYNFCLGLCKINILNRIIILFDNDAAGVEKYTQILSLRLPKNLLVIKLPNYSDFDCFDTEGPQGNSKEDINGKAVSIECFLDFTCVQYNDIIRWTSYNKNVQLYQGELIGKDKYTTAFLKNNDYSKYDFAKLKFLLNYIFTEWANRSK